MSAEEIPFDCTGFWTCDCRWHVAERAEPEDVTQCAEGHDVLAKRTEHHCAPAWEAYCPKCYDIGSPHGHGETKDAALEDFHEQENER